MKVCIDSGHAGQYNKGLRGYYESEGNWRFSLVLAKVLSSRGADVILTKTSLRDDPNLSTRGRIAAEFGADVFLSIHSDANNSASARGVHAIRSLSKPASEALGIKLVDAIAGAMGIPARTRKVWTWESTTRATFDRFTVMDWSSNYRRMGGRSGSDVPNMFLIERGYHTNYEDVTKLANSSLDIPVANAIADVLELKGNEGYMVKVGTVVNVSSSLRVRSSPTTANDGNIVGSLNNGDQVPVIAEGTWHKIIFDDKVAYSHSDYISVSALGTGNQAELDAERARTAAQKAMIIIEKGLTDKALTSLMSEQTMSAALLKDLKSVASNMISLEKFKEKYS